MEVASTKRDSEYFLFSSLTFSQIWLIPQVNDHQSNLTKLRKKEKKKLCSRTVI
jgi:hypothetical protein